MVAAAFAALAAPGAAQVTGFGQAVAEAAATNDAIAAFYRERGFAGFWTGAEAEARRNALLTIFAQAPAHGLPAARFDAAALMARMQAATGAAERGALDVELTRLYVDYANAVGVGVLIPGRVDPHNKRETTPREAAVLLAGLAAADQPLAYLQDLAPRSVEYARLLAAKTRLESEIRAGGWGLTVAADRLEPGAAGPAVLALRDRLTAMGWLAPSVSGSYDSEIAAAVRAFQEGHGLTADGVAGASTIAEINTSPEARLRQVIVAMERERWLGDDRGDRHIWVNLVDFRTNIVDHDVVTFTTRSVIGATGDSRQTPEFSDLMNHMVINPTWYIPRSIIVGEYLPQLQRNRNAAGHLRITDGSGREVNRANIDFSRYNARNFPFAMQQPPSRSNALGEVKFMFPNQWNIYLHDTPAQDLFTREVRAFSHGCIRLDDPREFAFALLAGQVDDPEGYFMGIRDSGRETRVNLDQPVPVHLDYRTAFTDVSGRVEYRRDVYGRDAAIWNALEAAGVTIPALQG